MSKLGSFIDQIKDIIRGFISPEMIDKILGYFQKAQEFLAKIIEYLIQAKDWIFGQVAQIVTKLFG